MFYVDEIMRFWSKVKVTARTEDCWIWNGLKTKTGYGQMSIGGRKGKIWFTHRFSYQLAYGEIPEGAHVLHRCDNPSCVNPNHLFLGTHKDNMQDMVNKGRKAIKYGEDTVHHKLTADKVISIRERFARGGISQSALAREMGVTQVAIQRIVTRRTWKHIT